MKGGAENRKKTILAGVSAAVALCFVIYTYETMFGGPSAPPPAPTPTAVTTPAAARPASSAASGTSQNTANGTGAAAAPGVAAKKLASTSSSLDPTLDESAMLRTENLVYSGTGRNIFSAVYTPPPAALPKNVPAARPAQAVYVPTGPPPPPPLPPINLKFFGTEVRANGEKQAFLLSGEDVYLASQNDIVARKYKIMSIGTNTVQVKDLTNDNVQTLPLQP